MEGLARSFVVLDFVVDTAIVVAEARARLIVPIMVAAVVIVVLDPLDSCASNQKCQQRAVVLLGRLV